MDENNGAVVVSWNFSDDGDNDILVVGERRDTSLKIINSFKGKEARNLHKKLITPKKKQEETTNE